MGSTLSPAEIAEKYAEVGAGKAKRSTSLLIVLGILAGALIALGSAATNTAVYGIQDTWTARTICGLLFPFGLGMVVIMGAELFTGNCLMSIALLGKDTTVTVFSCIMAMLVAESRIETNIHTVSEVCIGALMGMLVTLILFEISNLLLI